MGVSSEPPDTNVPLRGEVHKLRGELVCRKLGRRFFHHLLQLLKGRPPRVVREAQDGELDLRPQQKGGGFDLQTGKVSDEQKHRTKTRPAHHGDS